MEVSKDNRSALAVCSSTPSFQESLDAQKGLFQSQIDQLHDIVLTQCKLTGVNPLSQEMAAGALSINIGKRPRDLLNPKAVKYMQSIFSIKDAINKRECREISALFGVTVTQVREFFTSQRTRVRRFVRLSREKAVKSNTSNENQDGVPTNSDATINPVPLRSVDPTSAEGPIDPIPLNSVDPTSVEGPINPVPFNSVDPTSVEGPINSVPMSSVGPTSVEGPINPIPLSFVGPTSGEEGPSSCPPDESLPGIDESDKHFLDNIFSLMRHEETFSGQVKLMEWILHRKNSAVLMWFLTKGGVMILATWLSQAAFEEQTSVLHVILKVLCHLPLHKALPAHMSAILQSVNRLRFYRASDISNRARVLLSRWSKLFARTQALKKPSAAKSSSDAQNEMLLKQSIGEIMEAESWDSGFGIAEETLGPSHQSSEIRKLGSQQQLKLLPASADDSNKKLVRGVSSSQTRERRKVVLVEQPGQRTGGRSMQVSKSVPASQGRPLSVDDIQKAKMRAQFMQSKYGKPGTSTNEGHQTKIEGSNKSSSSHANMRISPPRSPVRPQIEEHKKPITYPPNNNTRLEPEEPLWKKCKRVQKPWLTPPEIRINDDWSIGTGDNSKEVDVQKNRIRREKEIVYSTPLKIPSDPKDPWDCEMDYDDTLTPEIPIEQLPDPDADVVETMVSSCENGSNVDAPATTSSQNGQKTEMPEPDLELLAVLLKNPELVFALTSGQSGGLSSEDTVKLLDMIKANGVNSMGNLNGLGGNAEDKVEVSLPSPTPSSNPVTSGWRPEVAKNPFSRQSAVANTGSGVVSTISAQERPPVNGSVQLRLSETVTFQMSQQAMPSLSLPQTAISWPENTMPRESNSLPQYPTATPACEMLTSHTQQIPSVAFPNQLLPTRTPLQYEPGPPPIPEPMHSAPHSWSARQGLSSNQHIQASQNDYDANYAMYGVPQRVPMRPGPHWGREDHLGRSEFETWSPERVLNISPDYVPERSYGEPRMNMGHNYRPERSRPRGYSGYRDHNNRYDNRRWRGNERERRRWV